MGVRRRQDGPTLRPRPPASRLVVLVDGLQVYKGPADLARAYHEDAQRTFGDRWTVELRDAG